MADKDILADAKEAFEQASEAENDNRNDFIDDLKFARLADQWPDKIKRDREKEFRPCLTVNRMPAFIRQVVNDARQNKPSIKVHPADSNADPATAKVYDGLIRNIEYASSADAAYDTATESAVSGGWGYIAVDIDFSHDDSFDLDLKIRRIPDPMTVYGDPASMEADSSDWNTAFEVVSMTEEEFERDYKGADKVNWETDYGELGEPWYSDNMVMVAKWWTREEAMRKILLMSNGQVLPEEALEHCKEYLDAMGVTVVKDRDVKSWKVKRRILTGAEILKTEDWAGKYIPIIPVYGDEVVVEGKRHFRSLIRDAKDPQRMFNYWRTTTTELIALAPKTPFIGPKGAFKTDAAKWQTANTQNHSYLEFDGQVPPQRQPFVGVPAGALQEALNSADDMKAIMGIYDPALGARSNETSGVAINARKRESDVATFHFIDNMSRAIRHCGRVLIDLIPHVYTKDRIIRVLGEDKKPEQIPLGKPVPVKDPDGKPVMQPAQGPDGQPMMGPNGPMMEPKTQVYDLGLGKYDLTVTTGPSFTSRREEAAAQMIELIRALPAVTAVVAPHLAKNLDWPGADEIARKLEQMAGGGVPPEVQKGIQDLKQTAEQLQQQLQQLQQENAALKADQTIKMKEVEVKAFDAETKRMEAVNDSQRVLVEDRRTGAETEIKRMQIERGVPDAKPDDKNTGQLIDMLGRMMMTKEVSEMNQNPDQSGGLLAAIMQSAQVNAQSAEMMSQSAAMMAQAAAQMSAPKKVKVVRDKSGKMTGTETEAVTVN